MGERLNGIQEVMGSTPTVSRVKRSEIPLKQGVQAFSHARKMSPHGFSAPDHSPIHLSYRPDRERMRMLFINKLFQTVGRKQLIEESLFVDGAYPSISVFL